MRKYWRHIVIAAILVVLATVLGCYYGRCKSISTDTSTDTISHTDISWSYVTDSSPRIDTFTYVKTIIVPVKDISSSGNKGCNKDDDDSCDVTAAGDSVVSLPIMQRIYSDSTYTAYVSGYCPSLDSIKIRTKTITNTISVTATKYKNRRFGVGLVGGYGYGLGSGKFEPFVGVGVTINLLK